MSDRICSSQRELLPCARLNAAGAQGDHLSTVTARRLPGSALCLFPECGSGLGCLRLADFPGREREAISGLSEGSSAPFRALLRPELGGNKRTPPAFRRFLAPPRARAGRSKGGRRREGPEARGVAGRRNLPGKDDHLGDIPTEDSCFRSPSWLPGTWDEKGANVRAAREAGTQSDPPWVAAGSREPLFREAVCPELTPEHRRRKLSSPLKAPPPRGRGRGGAGVLQAGAGGGAQPCP